MKRSIFKIIAVLIVCILALSLHGFAEEEADPEKIDLYTGGDSRFYYWDSMLFANENTMYPDLAKASAALAVEAYSSSGIRTLLDDMGFTILTDGSSYDLVDNMPLDDCHHVAYTIAKKEIGGKIIYCVPIKGTSGNYEWFSNFTMGDGDDTYHEGFYESSLDVLGALISAIGSDGYNARNRIIWFTGHSRGGAVANILGGMFNRRDSGRVFCYTFACPSVTTNPVSYSNIYNFNISGDLIPIMPMSEWGFGRHGTTYPLPSPSGVPVNTDAYSSELLDLFPTMASASKPASKLAMMGIATLMADRVRPSFGELAKYCGVTLSEDAFEFFQSVIDSPIEYFISSMDETTQHFADIFAPMDAYMDTISQMNDEEFQEWLLTQPRLTECIQSVTDKEILTYQDYRDLYITLRRSNSEMNSVYSLFADTVALFSDTNGNPMSAIAVGHKGESYISKVNGQFYGDSAMQGSNIQSITISDNIRTIGPDCFRDCQQLTTVALPEKLTVVGDSAFQDCNSITSIEIPDSVKTIGDSAFAGCSSVNYLKLPISAEYGCSDYNSSFGGMTNIAELEYTPGDGSVFTPDYYYDSVQYLSRKNLKTVILSEGFRELYDSMFYDCEALTTVKTSREDPSGVNKFPSDLQSIPDSAFYGCRNLSGNLLLPDSLTSIGENAFYRCSSLSGNILLPESLTSIGASAFCYCGGLSGDLLIPNLLTSVAERTFYYCYGLSGELHLPDSLITICDRAFCGCSNLSGELHLPDSLTSIGDYAFAGCHSFSGELHIPSSITRIEDGTFSGCWSLSGELHLNDSLAFIGRYAFARCSSFSGSLNIPNSITKIEDGTFEECSSIESIEITDSVKSIGKDAFKKCLSLSRLKLPISVEYQTLSYAPSFFDCPIRELEYTIGDGTVFVPENNIYSPHRGASTVILPEGITEIYAHMFDSAALTTIKTSWDDISIDNSFPSTLLSISEYAFSNCRNLSGNLHLPDSLSSIGDSAFYGCCSLSGDLLLPESLTSIGYSAFYGCSGLSGNLHLPDSLMSISSSAFSGCSGLTGEVFIPNGITEIRYQTFYGCSSLSGEICLPDSLTSIGNGAFYNCRGLSGDLHLPDSLTSIGSGAFYNCSGFSGDLRIPEAITEIKASTFYGCSGFSGELCLPASLTSIDQYAFYGCKGFSGDLYLPDSLTSIGVYAFCGCKGFSGDLYLPDSLTSIGGSAFCGCSGFSGDLFMSDSLTSIGGAAFSGCSGFSGILHLPDSLISIGAYAFSSCSGFSSELCLPDSLTSIGNNAFSSCSGLSGELHLPDSLTSIGAYAFSSCYSLSGKITGGGNIEEIGQYAFSSCEQITGINLSEKITTISRCAFYGCRSLQSIVIPSKVTFIGSRAFCACYSLKGDISLGINLENIGEGAFEGCHNITGITFPEKLTAVGDNAFKYCFNLTYVFYSGAQEQWEQISIGINNDPLRNAVMHYEAADHTGIPGGYWIAPTYEAAGSYCALKCQVCGLELCEPLELPVIPEAMAFRLPAALTEVGEEAFDGNEALVSVELGAQCQAIAENAFRSCTGLQFIVISNGGCSIADNAFAGCPDTLVIVTVPGSAVEEWALQNGRIAAHLK